MTDKKKPVQVEASGMKVRCAYDKLEDPTKLTPHPLNPNKHPPKQLEMFHKIVQYQGWRRAVTVSNRSGFMTRGHGAVAMAMQAGLKLVPVDFQDYDSEQEELADIVADNQLAELAVMDQSKLNTILVQLDNGAFDMELTAFDQGTLERMMAATGQAPEITLDGAGDGVGPEYAEPRATQDSPPTGQPVSHVRMVQLFLNEGNIGEFMTIVEHFQKKLGTANVTETVMKVLQNAKAADA